MKLLLSLMLLLSLIILAIVPVKGQRGPLDVLVGTELGLAVFVFIIFVIGALVITWMCLFVCLCHIAKTEAKLDRQENAAERNKNYQQARERDRFVETQFRIEQSIREESQLRQQNRTSFGSAPPHLQQGRMMNVLSSLPQISENYYSTEDDTDDDEGNSDINPHDIIDIMQSHVGRPGSHDTPTDNPPDYQNFHTQSIPFTSQRAYTRTEQHQHINFHY